MRLSADVPLEEPDDLEDYFGEEEGPESLGDEEDVEEEEEEDLTQMRASGVGNEQRDRQVWAGSGRVSDAALDGSWGATASGRLDSEVGWARQQQQKQAGLLMGFGQRSTVLARSLPAESSGRAAAGGAGRSSELGRRFDEQPGEEGQGGELGSQVGWDGQSCGPWRLAPRL